MTGKELNKLKNKYFKEQEKARKECDKLLNKSWKKYEKAVKRLRKKRIEQQLKEVRIMKTHECKELDELNKDREDEIRVEHIGVDYMWIVTNSEEISADEMEEYLKTPIGEVNRWIYASNVKFCPFCGVKL